MKECTKLDWERNTQALDWQRVRVHDKLVAVIKETLGSNGSILEIGPQTGLDSECLALSGYNVSVVDYNGAAIELLRQREGINPIIGDGRELPFKDSSFDLVYSQGLIEHYIGSDLSALVEEQKRVIRPGGYVIIDVPNTLSLNTIPKQVLIALGKWIVPWETQYTPRQLKDLGEKHGLEFVRGYAWGYDQFVGERIKSVLARLFETSFRQFEDKNGHYFMKCVGAVFRKSSSS